MINQTISHFRILEKLGAGGMGVVYKALDTRLDRAVALKFLPDNMVQDSQALERFRREAHAASTLNHPGICTIYDIGEQDHRPFIAMEFIDGDTLRQHIHGQPLTVDHLLDLGIQIADALDVAHAEGIIHRDIKPSNVFVTKRGQTKVLDFGLAKLIPKNFLNPDPEDPSSKAPAEPVSVVGIISGTPAYMSPEQVRGDDLDPRTDIFALGLLLYEMATGRQAFSGRTGGAIIEAILTRNPVPANSLNPELPARLEEIIHKCLEKDRNSRYSSAGAVRTDLQWLKRVSESGQLTSVSSEVAVLPRQNRFSWKTAAGAALLAILLLGPARFYAVRRAQALTQSDTIVLADFTNKTGDPIFEDTLRQGLAAQLQQSPFLSLVSDQRIEQTLRLMGRPPDTKLSSALAGDLCQRTGSKAYLSGSISSMGSDYVIGVNAVNCQTGDFLSQEQVIAKGKENVLNALGKAASQLREKLGESLKTLQTLDTPIYQATTPSLEALQAYSLGRKTMQGKGDFASAVPLFERSIQLDPKFAMAYATLGTAYYNIGEKNRAVENTRKAYELRQQVSEWEKFYIESHYHHFATGDLEKARQVYELWAQIYPREQVPAINLGVVNQSLGQFEKSLADHREALRLGPSESINFSNLLLAHVHLNHLRDARLTGEEALAKNLDSPEMRLYLYQLAFLKQDVPGMARQFSSSLGKPGEENVMLNLEAATSAYFGRIAKAREYSRRAVASAGQAGEREVAAGCEAAAALREALFGNASAARQHASRTLVQSNGRDAQYLAALALALVGDSARARTLADDLEQRFPEDTVIHFNYLPTLRAQLALNTPSNAAKALETLAIASPYELGAPGNSTFWTSLYPIYVRGQAFLAFHQGTQAVTEFQKILDWPGVALNEPIGVLARLGLARAFAIQGDAVKSKSTYQDFLTLWTDADSDVPVLIAAKSELARVN
jgi:eukaryotic-like serine/threonine-protein kinase